MVSNFAQMTRIGVIKSTLLHKTNKVLETLFAVLLNKVRLNIFVDSAFCGIFTESALRPIQSVSRDVRLFVSLSVRHTLETTLPEGLETSGRRAYR